MKKIINLIIIHICGLNTTLWFFYHINRIIMKILAANIPEYFPSIHFYLKMILSDVFVLADNLLFSKHSLVNRTKINTPQGWQWLTVPVFSSKKGVQNINEVSILPESNWQRKHKVALKTNYKFSPFFEHYMFSFESVFDKEWKSILELDIACIELIIKQLKINKELFYSLNTITENKSTELIVELAKTHNCNNYFIFDSETSFVDQNVLENAGIGLVIKKFDIRAYRQQFEPFKNDLSILDLLFNLGNESQGYLHSCLK